MAEKYFFEIPIYRCNIEKHTNEMENEKQKLINYAFKNFDGDPTKTQTYEIIINRFDKYNWYPWYYNEIIGYIRLYSLGTQVRGELWFINAKRLRRDLKRKKFYYRGKAFELHFYPKDSSNKIYQKIDSELKKISKENPLKNRYLELETFHNIGPFINWQELIGLKLKNFYPFSL